MLQGILTAAVLRRVVTQIPDERIMPYGGVWGQRVPSVDATHDELTEFDGNVATAANLLPQGAPNIDETELPTDIVLNRAFRLKRSVRLGQPDIQAVLRVAESPNSDAARQALLARAQTITTRNLQGVAITRGILCASMAVGEVTAPERFGWKNSPTDFGMPGNLKAVPGTFWRNTAGVTQTGAKPVSDIAALDYQASVYGESEYTDLDISRDGFFAMLGTDEYKAAALARAGYYNVANLPVGFSPLARQLASDVLGKNINLVDNTFVYTDAGGNRISGRYYPEAYAVLWRSDDAGKSVNWDFANVEITESGIALIAGDNAYGGAIQRGPYSYTSCDRDEFTNARLHGIQEGVPRRYNRAVTAVLVTRGG